jgi:hypothetical protein
MQRMTASSLSRCFGSSPRWRRWPVYAVYVANTASSSGERRPHPAQGLVTAAIELTAYRLTAVDQQVRPCEGLSFRMGGANIGVEFRSEAARIDLNDL